MFALHPDAVQQLFAMVLAFVPYVLGAGLAYAVYRVWCWERKLLRLAMNEYHHKWRSLESFDGVASGLVRRGVKYLLIAVFAFALLRLFGGGMGKHFMTGFTVTMTFGLMYHSSREFYRLANK